MNILAQTAKAPDSGRLGTAAAAWPAMIRDVLTRQAPGNKAGQNGIAKSKNGTCRRTDQPGDAIVTAKPSLDSTPELAAQRMTALLGALKERQDEAVFAELFRFFAPRVKSYMRKLGAPEDVAEELAQEALAMVWRKAHMFDAERAGAATWIFSIARNLRIDAFRRQRRPELLLDDPTLVPDSPDSPEIEMDRSQQATAVRQALATLPREQATIVHLSFFEDKPHAVIAEQLGIPLGTVKSRMRLAFQRFRKALGEPES